jgi:ABC-type nitrate/sulfonate/bicarbonate transport system permease component
MYWQELLQNIISSVGRVSLGVFFGSVIGLTLGVFRFSLPLRMQNNFLVNLLFDGPKYPPPIAWIPFIILGFGIGFFSSVVVVTIAAIPPVFTQVYDALNRLNRRLYTVLQNLEVVGTVGFYKIALRAVLPEIFTGLQIALGMGWMAVIAAEMVGGQEGLGYAIQFHRMNLDYTAMSFDLLAIGAVGFLLNRIGLYFRIKFCPWKTEGELS